MSAETQYTSSHLKYTINTFDLTITGESDSTKVRIDGDFFTTAETQTGSQSLTLSRLLCYVSESAGYFLQHNGAGTVKIRGISFQPFNSESTNYACISHSLISVSKGSLTFAAVTVASIYSLNGPAFLDGTLGLGASIEFTSGSISSCFSQDDIGGAVSLDVTEPTGTATIGTLSFSDDSFSFPSDSYGLVTNSTLAQHASGAVYLKCTTFAIASTVANWQSLSEGTIIGYTTDRSTALLQTGMDYKYFSSSAAETNTACTSDKPCKAFKNMKLTQDTEALNLVYLDEQSAITETVPILIPVTVQGVCLSHLPLDPPTVSNVASLKEDTTSAIYNIREDGLLYIMALKLKVGSTDVANQVFASSGELSLVTVAVTSTGGKLTNGLATITGGYVSFEFCTFSSITTTSASLITITYAADTARANRHAPVTRRFRTRSRLGTENYEVYDDDDMFGGVEIASTTFTSISRSSGNGGCIDIASTQGAGYVSFSSVTFTQCSAVDGNGGAIAMTLKGSEIITGSNSVIFSGCTAKTKAKNVYAVVSGSTANAAATILYSFMATTPAENEYCYISGETVTDISTTFKSTIYASISSTEDSSTCGETAEKGCNTLDAAVASYGGVPATIYIASLLVPTAATTIKRSLTISPGDLTSQSVGVYFAGVTAGSDDKGAITVGDNSLSTTISVLMHDLVFSVPLSSSISAISVLGTATLELRMCLWNTITETKAAQDAAQLAAKTAGSAATTISLEFKPSAITVASQFSAPLVKVGRESELLIAGCTFRNITLTSDSLIECSASSTLTVQSYPKSGASSTFTYFDYITRSKGDGSVFGGECDALSSVTFSTATFTHCATTNGNGGALAVGVHRGASVTLSYVTFNSCSATLSKAASHTNSALPAETSASAEVPTKGSRGGAVYLVLAGAPQTLSLKSFIVSGCTADVGTAVCAVSVDTVLLTTASYWSDIVSSSTDTNALVVSTLADDATTIESSAAMSKYASPTDSDDKEPTNSSFPGWAIGVIIAGVFGGGSVAGAALLAKKKCSSAGKVDPSSESATAESGNAESTTTDSTGDSSATESTANTHEMTPV